jgi:hypothetical protein
MARLCGCLFGPEIGLIIAHGLGVAQANPCIVVGLHLLK